MIETEARLTAMVGVPGVGARVGKWNRSPVSPEVGSDLPPSLWYQDRENGMNHLKQRVVLVLSGSVAQEKSVGRLRRARGFLHGMAVAASNHYFIFSSLPPSLYRRAHIQLWANREREGRRLNQTVNWVSSKLTFNTGRKSPGGPVIPSGMQLHRVK